MLLCVVPLAGLCATGSWRQAWRYSRDWGRVVLLLVIAAAAVVWLVIGAAITPP